MIELVKKQKEFYNYVLNTNNIFKILLTGSAGTGKTTTLVHTIKSLIKEKPHVSIQVLTPTHQSSIVVQKMMKNNDISVDVGTIHSYFNIKPDINEDGERVFKPASEPLIQHSFFIIDESSMIDSDLLKIINKYLFDKQVVFVGDEYQLPPVNYDRSPVFSLDFDAEFKLEEVIRTKNANTEVFEKIRLMIKEFKENNKKYKLSEIFEVLKSSDNINFFTENEFINFFQLYVKERFENKKNVKIGSFTNAFVEHYNLQFRKFDKEVQDTSMIYSVGDKVIFNEPYNFWPLVSLTDKKIKHTDFIAAPNYLRNGEEMIIDEISESELTISSIQALTLAYNVYQDKNKLNQLKYLQEIIKKRKIKSEVFICSMKEIDNETKEISKTGKTVIIPRNPQEIKDIILELFQFAKLFHFSNNSKKMKKDLWKIVYTIKDYYGVINYAYASTIHKLQGQTLNEIFIDIRDFTQLYNQDYNLFLRLLYVGLTRTENEVFMLN